MKVVITGARGFLGRRLAARLAAEGLAGGHARLDRLVLLDAQDGPPLAEGGSIAVEYVRADLSDPRDVAAVIDESVGGVFHLAAVVSGEAERDFDLGMRANVEGTRNLLEACRVAGRRPRVVFASSLAVYGGEAVADDRTPVTPMSSYGTQKAIGELLVSDYTRRGFIDGRSLRLPTIAVRPGRPNAAASSFVSSIIREPLTGKKAVCPVPPEVVMPIMSPRRVVEALVHAFELDGEALGTRRTVLLPACNPTMGEMVEALRRVAGDEVAGRVEWRLDPFIHALVRSWPERLVARRALELGFEPDASVEEIICAFIEEELGGRLPAP